MSDQIKEPTMRKVRNRGFVPVRYQTDEGFFHGWVTQRGTKWLRFFSISHERTLRLPLAEERFMKEVGR